MPCGSCRHHLVPTHDDDVFGVCEDPLSRRDQHVFRHARHAVRGEEAVVLLHTKRLARLAVSGAVYRQGPPVPTQSQLWRRLEDRLGCPGAGFTKPLRLTKARLSEFS